ncbi:TerD family protein [Rhodococcoides fascians]|uniref:TerD family protein n=1 Tax=Rhodococcoides fascians TaxID=1828 RepID=UPI000AEE7E2A|nr:TerD family protein [Rhodococcus fascians]
MNPAILEDELSFGFRVGVPGMRVRVSTRGVRTSLGPRAARINVGSGRTTVSSGLGPFFASTSLSSGRGRTTTRRTTRRHYGPSPAQLARAERAAARAQQDAQRDAAIAELHELRRSSTSVHLDTFPIAAHPVIPPPPALHIAHADAQATAHHLSGIGLLARTERKRAKERARTDAQHYLAAEQHRLRHIHEQLQHHADQWWNALITNHEPTVCDAINSAFADNAAAGCALGVTGTRVSIVMRQQDIDTLPTQTPSLTSAGRPTLKTLTKRDRIAWWLTIMGSNVIATCKEALAVAPGITDVDLAVITRLPDTQRLGIVTYGSWSRRAIDSTPWHNPNDALRFLDVGTDVACSVRTTASGNLSSSVKPLDIDRIPGLAELLDTTDDDSTTNPISEIDAALTPHNQPTDAPTCDDPYAPIPFSQWVLHQSSQSLPPISPPPHAPTPATTPTTLSPGQTLPLLDEAVHQIDAAFEFQGADADMTLLLLEHTGRVGTDDDFIFYNRPIGSGGAIRLHHKDTDATTTTERATLHLSDLPPRITTVVISINIDVESSQTCADLQGARLTISTPQQSWLFTPPPDPHIRAMTAAQIYRHTAPDGTPIWKLRALGQGWADGLDGLARAHGVDID